MPRLDIKELFLPENYLNNIQELLEKYIPTAIVWAYGSRVTGNAHEASDLDLVLRHKDNISTDIEGVTDLIQAFEASMIPILIDVHQWTHLPKSFYPNIEKAYIVLQE